jgi:hypothetical protein
MAQRKGNTYKFVEETAKRILLSIRGGNFPEVAAAAAGISRATLLDWLKRGRRGASPALRDFAAEYEKAEAQAEEMAIAGITGAGRRDWRAYAWRLERQHFNRWGRRDKVEHVGEDGAPLAAPQVVLYMPDDGSGPGDDDGTAGGAG